MIFSSARFLLFLACVLALVALPIGRLAKLRILLVASCFFYAAWDYRYLPLLLAVSGIDYLCGKWIAGTEDHSWRRVWLWVSVTSNLGILAYYKYAGFFVDGVNLAGRPLGWSVAPVHVLLPIGISFFTFKTMSYTIDIYRRQLAPARSLLDYATFVTFFPELVAGPIVRAAVFLPQMSRQIGPTAARMRDGGCLFLLGLSKKLLIADPLSRVADPIFATPEIFGTGALWVGLLAYSLQIYCDFSGYSDMAIGTARMLGFDLPENFRMPYASKSLSEFWTRWHITLSCWLRDYLYIPLGGNRRGAGRTYANLMATMVLGGLWHGASVNFLVWGALHGGGLVAQRLAGAAGLSQRLPAGARWLLTVGFVCLCWVPFRSQGLDNTLVMYRGLFVPTAGYTYFSSTLVVAILVCAAAHLVGLAIERLGTPGAESWHFRIAPGIDVMHRALSGRFVVIAPDSIAGGFLLGAWLLIVFFFAALGTKPFIYFQF